MGTYSEGVSNGSCEACPANSEATQTGLTECPCIQDYYRATNEGPSVTCTRECETFLVFIFLTLKVISLFLANMNMLATLYIQCMYNHNFLFIGPELSRCVYNNRIFAYSQNHHLSH